MSRRLSLAVLFTLCLAAPARAQEPPTEAQQAEAVATLAAVGQHAYTDYAMVYAGSLIVGGWAFECSSGSQGDIDLLIDGMPYQPTPGSFFRGPREDVWMQMVNTGVCDGPHMPYFSGYDFLVPISALALAPGPHSVTLRIKNANGVMTTAARSQSFIVPLTLPARQE